MKLKFLPLLNFYRNLRYTVKRNAYVGMKVGTNQTMTSNKRYGLLKSEHQIEFVEMPDSHMYQLTALFVRLHKEIAKLTADNVPVLPQMIAEFDNLELVDRSQNVVSGLAYINRLEQMFAAVNEKEYPLVSLLTEIRALQAQLEQWYEEEAE